MVVDWIRRPYTAYVQPYRNSDRVERVDWYPAADDAPALPFSSRIFSIDYLDRNVKITDDHKGEVYKYPRPFNGRKALPYAVVPKPCGTETDFRDGGLYDPLAPPLPRDPERYPLCCLAQQIGNGGLVWGGQGTIIPNPPPSSYRITGSVGLDVVVNQSGAGTWQGFDPLHFLGWTLFDPTWNAGCAPGNWTVRADNGIFNVGIWCLASFWDGTGSRVFPKFSGSFPGDVTVTRL